MAVELARGGNISLEKASPGLTHILVGLGWDERSTDGTSFDLDASAFLLNVSEKVRSDGDFIFYNQLRSPDGSVEHTGDNLTGEGDGDDESLKVQLPQIPNDVEKISFTVTINDAEQRRQNFGMIRNAFIRVLNSANNEEICRYDLTEDFSIETALIFGELYRHSGEWKFRAVGQGFQGGLLALCNNFGVHVG
jgi:tellurium resistance protein TerD